MSDEDGTRPRVDLFVNETRQRQVVNAQSGSTTTLRLFGARPLRAAEVRADEGFPDGGAVPDLKRALGWATAVLEAHAPTPEERLLVAGHGLDEPLSRRRAEAVRALLLGDRGGFAAVAGERAAEQDAFDAALARQLGTDESGLAARREALTVVGPGLGAVGCGAHWTFEKLRLDRLPATTTERVDLLLVGALDAPKLACHAGPTCAPAACDLYRKAKYRASPMRAPVAPHVPPSGTLEVLVVNHKGLPLPGVLCQALLADGTKRGGVTSPEGVAKIDAFPHTGPARLDLPDFDRADAVASEGAPAAERVVYAGAPVPVALGEGRRFEVQVPPRLLRVRLVGLLFDHDKTFLLPKALPGIRRLKVWYDEFPGADVLVVGHADTSGKADYNQKLSEQRAKALGAFLRDEVDDWTPRYTQSPGGVAKLWGATEDALMLGALADDAGPFDPSVPGVKRFQTFSNTTQGTTLGVDGIVGPETRRALVTTYMKQDGTTLPEGTPLVTHGCGESHPAVETGDDVKLEENRRVEVFFFEAGITPPPCGGSTDHPEYPAWLGQVGETRDLRDQMPEVGPAQWQTGDEVLGPPVTLRLVDRRKQPCLNVRATVALEDGRRQFFTSDGEGKIRPSIPEGAKTIVVRFTAPDGGGEVEARVRLGLAPATSDDGAIGRLLNLGYPAEEHRDYAVFQFQADHGLPATGELDGATRARLTEVHDA